MRRDRETAASADLSSFAVGRAILAKLDADHPDFAQSKKDLAWFDAQIATLGK